MWFTLTLICSAYVNLAVAAPSQPLLLPSTHYAVRDLERNSSLFVYQSAASTDLTKCGYFNKTRGWTASWVQLTLPTNTSVHLEISLLNRKNNNAPREVRVLPPENADAVIAAGGSIIMTVRSTGQFYLEVDRQMDDRPLYLNHTNPDWNLPRVHTFHVFADPVFDDVPNISNSQFVRVVQPGQVAPKDGFPESVLYFTPGTHVLPGCEGGSGKVQPYTLQSNKRYYLAEGAWVHGVLVGNDVANVTIDGAGVLVADQIRRPAPCDNGGVKGLEIKGKFYITRNITIRGITLADMPGHNMALGGHDFDVSWVKIFSWRINGDGVDGPGASGRRHALWLRDSFLRVQDDAMYMESGHRYERVRLWRDCNGKNFLFGGEVVGHSYPEFGTLVKDCDVLYDRMSYRNDKVIKAAAGIFSDKFLNTFQNLTVENVRVFDPNPYSSLIQIGNIPHRNGGPNLAKNQRFVNLNFTNVHVTSLSYGNGINTALNVLRATTSGSAIQIRMRNVTIAGRQLKMTWGNTSVWDVEGRVEVVFD